MPASTSYQCGIYQMWECRKEGKVLITMGSGKILRRRGLAVSLNMNTLRLEEKRSPGHATLDRWERDSICRDNRSKSCEKRNTGQGMRAGPL